MKRLSSAEKMVLLGLLTYPDRKDMDIAEMLSLPNSTFASVKSRISEMGYLNEIYVPVFPALGFELIATVYSDFNPSVSVEERIDNTRRTVEVYPEMVLSIGESHRGFSISVAENVTRIMSISHERIKILADMNLLEIELPQEVLFPFEMSHVHRFFNLAPLFHARLEREDPALIEEIGFPSEDIRKHDNILNAERGSMRSRPADVNLSRKQLEVMYYLVKYPHMSASALSSTIPYSRHTISRVRDMLINEGYIRKMVVPDLSRIGYSILSLFHVKIDPKRPLSERSCNDRALLQDDTVFFISRPTELIMLALYENYPLYNRGMSSFNQFLKANEHMLKIPTIRNHSLSEAIWVKNLVHHPLIKETFHLDVE